MKAPPIPSVLPSPPPDPDTLPPPPPLQWDPLPSKGSEEQPGLGDAVFVPPPQPEPSIAPPPPPMIETPLPGGPNLTEMALAQPDVEIWRDQSEWPQVPARRSNRLDQAYVTGTEPVWLRVQFDPAMAGKRVYVKPGRGITLDPPVALLTISSSGECLVLARLGEGLARGYVIFYCERVKTILPVLQTSLAKVEEKEAETGGGQ
jgi:hypothetical protein